MTQSSRYKNEKHSASWTRNTYTSISFALFVWRRQKGEILGHETSAYPRIRVSTKLGVSTVYLRLRVSTQFRA